MIGWILFFLVLWIVYLVIKKSKASSTIKKTAFDEFLIERYKESEIKAKLIGDTIEVTDYKPITLNWKEQMYIEMILCDKYNSDELRVEAKSELGITDDELDTKIKIYKHSKR